MTIATSAIRNFPKRLLNQRKGASGSATSQSSSTSSSSSLHRGIVTSSTSILSPEALHSQRAQQSNPKKQNNVSTSRCTFSSSASNSSPTHTRAGSSSSSPESVANETVKSSFQSMFNQAVNTNNSINQEIRQSVPSTGVKEAGQLIILRHGQSTWNQQNIFIGMTDTPLTPDGVLEARVAGNLLEGHEDVDIVYTSLLRRSTKTVWLVMQELGLEWVPIIKDWRLNERNYGALVGRNKKQAVEEFGKEQVKLWRRSYDVPPPPMDVDSEYWPGKDPRYQALGIDIDCIPRSECLMDVCKRTSIFFDECIVPEIKKGKKSHDCWA